MPVPITCVECGREYSVSESLVGKRVKCRQCGQPVPVEAPVPVAEDEYGNPIEDDNEFDDFEDVEGLSPKARARSQPTADKPRTRVGKPARKSGRPPKPFWKRVVTGETTKREKVLVFGGVGTVIVSVATGFTILLVTLFNNASKMWDGASQTGKLFELKGHAKDVHSVAISPDGTLGATSGADGVVKLWSMKDGSELRTLNASANQLAFSPDGKSLATGSGKSVTLWDPATGERQRTLKLAQARVAGPKAGHIAWNVTFLAFSPDGKWLAGSSNSIGGIHPSSRGTAIWDLANDADAPERILPGRGCVAFSPDGSVLATGGGSMTSREGRTEGIIMLFQTSKWQKLHQLLSADRKAAHPGGNTTCFAFSPDGKTLASGASDSEALVKGKRGLNKNRASVRLWEVASGRLLHTIEGAMKHHTMVAFCRDGNSLLVAGGNPYPTMKTGGVNRYNVETGELSAKVIDKSFIIQSAALSPDGKRLLIACNNIGGAKDRAIYDKIRQRNKGYGAPKEPPKKRANIQDVFVEVWGM